MEEIVPRLSPTKQDELVRRYCAEAETLLAAAPDYPAAVRLKEALCTRFERECDSQLIISAVKQFISEHIRKHWETMDIGDRGTLHSH